jgi:hypothetical protein
MMPLSQFIFCLIKAFRKLYQILLASGSGAPLRFAWQVFHPSMTALLISPAGGSQRPAGLYLSTFSFNSQRPSGSFDGLLLLLRRAFVE